MQREGSEFWYADISSTAIGNEYLCPSKPCKTTSMYEGDGTVERGDRTGNIYQRSAISSPHANATSLEYKKGEKELDYS